METYISYVPTALIVLIITVFVFYKNAFSYWEKRGIPTIEPKIILGNFPNPLSKKEGLISKVALLHKQFKLRNVKIGGLYIGTSPILMPINPDYVRDIMAKDAQCFLGRGNTINKETEPLLAHLINMEGDEWKEMRIKLTPAFTSGKMKTMFQTLVDCGIQMEEYLKENNNRNKPMDIKEVLACYSTDVIGSCAFGIECNSFKYPNAEFRSFGKRILKINFRRIFRRYFSMVSTKLVKLFNLNSLDDETHDFFLNVIKDMVKHRETNNVTRKDFLQLLINIKSKQKDAFTVEEMAAQAFVFFLAGFETSSMLCITRAKSVVTTYFVYMQPMLRAVLDAIFRHFRTLHSTTMHFCLYELAHRQEIQDKVRKEIEEVMEKHEGKLTYDAIVEMRYLDQVVDETLRMYPPVPMLQRVCTQNCTLSNGVPIEKGTKVLISAFGLQRDEEHFPNPEEFNPDRFSEENKHNIRPYTYVPFGEGPRFCIGLRFGKMQTKVGLCFMLKNYKMFPGENMKYPLEFHSNSFILASRETVLLRAEKI